MPRWDDDEPEGRKPNPKDCENCSFLIDIPIRGDCKAYTVAKPANVYFDGEKCIKKINNE